MREMGALLVQYEQGFGAALGGFGRGRVRDFLRQVPVEDFAEVVPLRGVGAQAAPHFLFQRQPEVFGDVLLGAPQQDGGRVGAVQVDRRISGEQQNPGLAELAFQFQCVEGVPAGPLNVLTHHRGEPGGRGAGFGQQVGQAAVPGQALVHERLVVAATAALLDVQAAGFDVPVIPGQVEPVRQPFPRGGDLPGDRPVGVLQFQGGGAAQHRHRHRLGRGG